MVKIPLRELGILSIPSTKYDEIVGEKLAEEVSKKWNLLRSRLKIKVSGNTIKLLYGKQIIATFEIIGDSRKGYYLISQ